MAKLAAAGRPGWSVSRIELDREGPSYTYDTLVELSERSESKSAQLFFITGADAFAEIATWSRYPAVLDLANFVVVSRPGITLDSMREQASGDRRHAKTRVILVEAHTPDISSTDIRRRVRAALTLTNYVPDSVADYIRDHRLYLGE
jgi:nicotinate-nucleotide adenylyltransferase